MSQKQSILSHPVSVVAGAAFFFLLNAGCASREPIPTSERGAGVQSGQRGKTESIRDLQIALLSLSSNVSPREAAEVSERAHSIARELAREYGAVRSPHLQNILVNVGLKERGLCYHWTEDLLRRLQELRLATLELHWGTARAGTLREHNCVVVTARGQPFAESIALDAWRHSRRLFWTRVRHDRYPWQRDAVASYASARDGEGRPRPRDLPSI